MPLPGDVASVTPGVEGGPQARLPTFHHTPPFTRPPREARSAGDQLAGDKKQDAALGARLQLLALGGRGGRGGFGTAVMAGWVAAHPAMMPRLRPTKVGHSREEFQTPSSCLTAG